MFGPPPGQVKARGRLRLWHRLRRPLFPPFFPPFHLILPFTATVPSTSLPQQAVSAASFPPPLPYTHSSFSLSTATPLPMPTNALALDPPPVSSNIRNQILAEIQAVGTRSGTTPNPSTSLFRADIPLNHPLRPLFEASLDSILQAVSH